MQLPDENDKYRTMCGALLSLFTFLVLISYAGFKLDRLLADKDYQVQESKNIEFFDQQHGFGYN